MHKPLANTVIIVYALLNGIIAFTFFVAALAVTFFTPFAVTMILANEPVVLPQGFTVEAVQQLATGMGIVIGIVLFALAALFLGLARGLWRRERWARYVQLAASVPQVFSFPFGTIVGAFGIYAFGFDAEIREQFGVAPAQPVPLAAKPARVAVKRAPKRKR